MTHFRTNRFATNLQTLPAFIMAVAMAYSGISSAESTTPTLASMPVADKTLSETTSLKQLISKIGRTADLSEAGGACGGITINDWVAENLRVIALGDSVQAVAPLKNSTAK